MISRPDGYGFLRTVNYSKGEKDIYISVSQIRRFPELNVVIK